MDYPEYDDNRSKSQTPSGDNYRHQRGDSFGGARNVQTEKSYSPDRYNFEADYTLKAKEFLGESQDDYTHGYSRGSSYKQQSPERFATPNARSKSTKQQTIDSTINRLYNPNPFRNSNGMENMSTVKKNKSYVDLSSRSHVPDFGRDSKQSPNKDSYTDRRAITQNDSFHEYSRSFVTDRSRTPTAGRKLMVDFGKEISPRPLTTQRSEISQKVKNDYQERQRKFIETKKQGSQRLENRFMRLEMERQCKMLENRVKRIQTEHQLMESRIKKGQNLVQKTVQSKKRHFDDLVNQENHRIKKQQEQEKMKQKIAQEKMLRAQKRQQAQEKLLADKRKKARDIKETIKRQLMDKDVEIIKEQTEKHWKYRAIADHEKQSRDIRKSYGNHVDSQMESSFHHYLESEDMKKKMLENQISQLAQYEGALIEQFKTTQRNMMDVADQMKRISSMKVDLDQPMHEFKNYQ